MLNIDKIKDEIIERLKPLKPNKIILFGSYAYGTPNKDSDIDLFLVTQENNNVENIEVLAMVKLRDLMKKYKIGFDILSADINFLLQRQDPFYKIDILSKGKVLYG